MPVFYGPWGLAAHYSAGHCLKRLSQACLLLAIWLSAKGNPWQKFGQGYPLAGRCRPLGISQSRGCMSRYPNILCQNKNGYRFLCTILLELFTPGSGHWIPFWARYSNLPGGPPNNNGASSRSGVLTLFSSQNEYPWPCPQKISHCQLARMLGARRKSSDRLILRDHAPASCKNFSAAPCRGGLPVT